MNLIHLHLKKDPILQIGTGVTITRRSAGERTYDGFELPWGPEGQVRLRHALRWHPLSSRPLTTDWLALAPDETEVELSLVDDTGVVVASVVDRVGPAATSLTLPQLRGPSKLARDRDLDLVITNRSTTQTLVSLLVSELNPGKSFFDATTGVGAEILSGRPARLLSGPDRDIFYIGSADHIATANAPAHPASEGWSQSLLGSAHDVPLVDGGLDFLLAEQILHRAVNPFGHIALWRQKLKPGGRVLCVVPYVAGGNDYLNDPTSISDWMDQFEKGGFQETQAHHNNFAKARDLNPKSLFRRAYPSSFSFFTPTNVVQAMAFAVNRLGYSGYHMEHGRNGQHIRFALYA